MENIAISGGSIFIIGLIFSIMAYFLRKTIIEKLDKLKIDFDELKLNIVSKEDYKEDILSNTSSHKELWTELNVIKVNIAKIEERQ